mgnify:CR=1 FL=1
MTRRDPGRSPTIQCQPCARSTLFGTLDLPEHIFLPLVLMIERVFDTVPSMPTASHLRTELIGFVRGLDAEALAPDAAMALVQQTLEARDLLATRHASQA